MDTTPGQPHELTDVQWTLLAPLLPDTTPKRGGRWRDHRTIINAVLFRLRTGCTWRDLTPAYGPWQTIHGRYQRWSADGTWTQILNTLHPKDGQADEHQANQTRSDHKVWL